MQFITPFFWIASIGIGLPILIHLVRRERAPSLLFSSLRFLRPITRKSFKFMKVRNPWVLLLRVLLVFLVVAAFARPFLPSAVTPLPDLRPDTATVILLDNSYSMSINGGFELAVAKAGDYISGLGPKDEAALVVFSDQASVISVLSREHAILKSLLQSKVVPSYRTTNYIPALRTADKLLSSRSGIRRSILLITDLQKAGYHREESFRLSPGLQLEVVPVGRGGGIASQVTEAHLAISGRSPKRTGKVSARLVKFNPSVTAAEAVLLLNGRRVARQNVAFNTDRISSVEFNDLNWPEGSVRGEIQVQTDAAPSSFYVVSEGRPRDEIAVIEGPVLRERRAPAFYLSRALAAAEGETFSQRVIPVSQIGELAFRSYRTIFLVGIDSLPGDQVARLLEAVQQGAGMVLVCSPTLSPDLFNATFSNLTPAKLVATVPRAREPVGVLGNIKYNHPIFRVFSETRTGNFLASRFHGYFSVTLNAGVQVLASFDDGNPALIERPLGRGRILLFTSTLDNSWNDLPLNPVFSPLIHQLVIYSGLIDALRNWVWVGESLPVQEKAKISESETVRVPSTYVTTPADASSELPVRETVYTFEQPGFYSFRANDKITYRAANVRPEELDLTQLNAEEFVASLVAPSSSPSGEARTPEGGKTRNPDSDWGLLILGLVFFLALAEAVIANRSFRQVF